MGEPRGGTVAAPRSRPWLVGLAIVAGCVALYGPTARHGFAWDDAYYVVPALRLELARLLGSDVLQAGDPATAPSGYWRPLASLTLWLDGKLPGGAAPFHLTNVALHAAVAALLFAVLLRRTGLLAASVAAPCWALHPEHVETVSWASCRYDLLAGLACVGLFAIPWRPGWRRAAWVGGVFAAGCLSKEAFPAVAVAVVVDDLAARRPVRDAWPSWAACGAALAAVLAMRGVLGIASIPLVPLRGVATDYLSAVAIYAGRAVAPLPLAIGHPYGGATVLLVAAGGTLTASLVATAWRFPRLAPGAAIFLGTLVPVALAMAGNRESPERYFYLPSLGIAWMLAEGIAALGVGRIRLAVAVALLAACGAGAIPAALRTRAWRDDASLFAAELALRPDDWRANLFAGSAAASEGRLDEAVRLLSRAAESDAGRRSWNVHAALAEAHFNRGDGERALAHATTAVALAPDRPRLRFDLAAALHLVGDHRRELEELEAAARRWPEYLPLREARSEAQCEVEPRSCAR